MLFKSSPILDQHQAKESSFFGKSDFHLHLYNSILSLIVKYLNYRVVFSLNSKAEHLAGQAYTGGRIILS